MNQLHQFKNYGPCEFIDVPPKSVPIVSMIKHNGQIFVATSEGVYRWSEKKQEFEPLLFEKTT